MIGTMPPKPAKPRNNAFVKYRTSKGWTQSQMAELLGYTREHYATIEAKPNGKLSLRQLTLLSAIKTAHGE